MQIVFDAKPADAKPLKGIVADRLRFALRRMSQQVSTARVSFTDVNGPRGGVDKHAQIQLHLESHGTVIVVLRPATGARRWKAPCAASWPRWSKPCPKPSGPSANP